MTIEYHYETDFNLESEADYSDWITRLIVNESKALGNINYIFCDDSYLNRINVEYLNHDTLTDIITFNYCDGDMISGDIYISIERVKDNAVIFNTHFKDELKRVMCHGVLHLFGYKDKTDSETNLMRIKENESIQLFHVEQ